jgi:hypothetical protein
MSLYVNASQSGIHDIQTLLEGRGEQLTEKAGILMRI